MSDDRPPRKPRKRVAPPVPRVDETANFQHLTAAGGRLVMLRPVQRQAPGGLRSLAHDLPPDSGIDTLPA